MTFNEVGFRYFYKKMCIVPIQINPEGLLSGFPNAQIANGYLAYGYMDEQAGLTLEVITGALIRADGKTEIFPTANDRRAMVRVNSVKDKEVSLLPQDTQEYLSEMFSEKIEALKLYDGTPALEYLRQEMDFDNIRHPIFIDDIQVHLLKDGYQTEICWARLIDYGANFYAVRLLNEPAQNFGFHSGEKIAVRLTRDVNGNTICCSY